jgi:hypothetical protein
MISLFWQLALAARSGSWEAGCTQSLYLSNLRMLSHLLFRGHAHDLLMPKTPYPNK